MKTLIAFYSLTGNTKKIAAAIAEATAGEVLEIKLKKEIPTKGFWKYFWGGRQAMIKELPELLPFDKNPKNYDLIFLGTPVWGSNFASAIRSFLAKEKLRHKKIALFCAHGGDDPGKIFANLEKELASNEIIGKIDFKMDQISEAQLAENLRKAGEWAKGVASK